MPTSDLQVRSRGGWALAWFYVQADTKRRPKAFCVGVITVVLAVATLGIIQGLIDTTSLLFLRMGEMAIGENDVVMRPQSLDNFVLNSTEIESILGPLKDVAGVAPRWALPALAVSRDNTDVTIDCFVLIIDSIKEEAAKMGRAFKPRRLNEQEAYVSQPIATHLGIRGNVGDRFYLQVDLKDLLAAGGLNANNLTDLANISSTNQSSILAQLLGFDPNAPVALFPNGNVNPLIDALNQANPIGLNLTLLDDLLRQNADATITQAQLLNLIGASLPSGGLSLNAISFLRTEVIALASLEQPNGKWPGALGNVVVMDVRYLRALIDEIIYQTPELRVFSAATTLGVVTTPTVPTMLTQVLANPADFAFTVTIQYARRFALYRRTAERMRLELAAFTDTIYTALGIDFPAENFTPIASYLNDLNLIVVMFGQAFVLVDVLLIALSVLLVSSLMLDNAEEKTYEYGMLRALGMVRVNLVRILTVNGVTFAVPGTLLGLFLGYIGFLILGSVIANFVAISLSELDFPASAIVLCILFGILMPGIANIFPIRQSLSGTLRDALDLTRQSFNATKVTITRLENAGLHPRELSTSIACLSIGFLAYYLFPYALLYSYFELAFGVLTIIIVGMVFGLSFIALALQPKMENAAARIVVVWRDARLRPLVLKHLAAHRKRSWKTAMLFTLSLSFIVFGSMLRETQLSLIVDNVKVFFGSDIRVMATSTADSLDEVRLSEVLRAAQADGLVDQFVFMTYPLRQTDSIDKSSQTNLAGAPTADVEVIGVGPNLLSVIDASFVDITETASGFSYGRAQGLKDVVRSMYTDPSSERRVLESRTVVTGPVSGLASEPGSQLTGADIQRIVDDANAKVVDCIVSQSNQKFVSLDTGNLHQLLNFARRRTGSGGHLRFTTLVRPRAVLAKLPGFSFSSYRTFARLGFTSVLVTIPAYEQMLQDVQNFTARNIPGYEANEKVKYSGLFVKMRPGTTTKDIESVANTMRNTFTTSTIRTLRLQNSLGLIQGGAAMIEYLSYGVVGIACIICFFSLSLSVYGNIQDNTWEYGVLRSLGLSAAALQRVYLYEMTCVVLVATFNGTIVGLVIAVILALFTTIFTEVPLAYEFPYGIYFIVITLAAAVVVIGTIVPTRRMNRMAITDVLRGLAA